MWLRSMEVIDRIFAGVPEDEVWAMAFDNVVELFGIRVFDHVLIGAGG